MLYVRSAAQHCLYEEIVDRLFFRSGLLLKMVELIAHQSPGICVLVSHRLGCADYIILCYCVTV